MANYTTTLIKGNIGYTFQVFDDSANIIKITLSGDLLESGTFDIAKARKCYKALLGKGFTAWAMGF